MGRLLGDITSVDIVVAAMAGSAVATPPAGGVLEIGMGGKELKLIQTGRPAD